MTVRTPLLAALFLLAASTAWPQQSADEHPELDKLPFPEWSAQGKRTDMRWYPRADVMGLSYHQRLQAHISIKIDGADLARLGGKRVIAFVQFTDAAGRQYRNAATFDYSAGSKDLRKQNVEIAWDAFVLPGEYRVAFALLHPDTAKRDFIETRFEVPALHHDPLPAAWSSLPTVEFLDPNDAAKIETIFQEQMAGRLNLPLAAPPPVRFEVLADLTPSSVFGGSPQAYRRYLQAAIPAIKVLAQVQVAGGKPSVTTLDLQRAQETLHQDSVDHLDWAALKRIAMAPEVALVDVRRPVQPSANFLRQELAQRIADTRGPRRRVYVILSSPLDPYSFPDPDRKLSSCGCVIYYLNFPFYSTEIGPRGRVIIRSSFSGVPRKVERMLSPLRVRSFSIASPEDFRAALAQILTDAFR